MDQTNFQDFYRKTAPQLWAYIYRSCRNSDLADDALQETFYRFLRLGYSEWFEVQMKAYLYKTATSVLVDLWRKTPPQIDTGSTQEVVSPKPLDLDLTYDVGRAFEELNSQEQLLLWLAYIEGFRHRQIAQVVGVKEQSVRVLLFRVRKKFAEILEERGLQREVS